MGALAKCRTINIELTLTDETDIENLPKDTILERIIYIMKKLRLNSNDFASKCGISSGAIQQWKSNKRIPHYSTIKKISNATGYSMEFIMSADNLPENTLAQVIYKYRILAGLTQHDLAELSGVAPPTIQDYESGRIAGNNKETISRILSVLNYQNK